jgi:hypothetical protein
MLGSETKDGTGKEKECREVSLGLVHQDRDWEREKDGDGEKSEGSQRRSGGWVRR